MLPSRILGRKNESMQRACNEVANVNNKNVKIDGDVEHESIGPARCQFDKFENNYKVL